MFIKVFWVFAALAVIGLISVGLDGPDKLGGLGRWLGAFGLLGSIVFAPGVVDKRSTKAGNRF